jgi:hypothetical protein
MPQLSLYLKEDTMRLVAGQAKKKKISLSRYVADILDTQSAQTWPASLWESFGAISDESFVVPEDSPPEDAPRFSEDG